MSPLAHRIYIGTLVSIVLITLFILLYLGIPYYMTPLEERFYHPDHKLFKPSGLLGHGLGIVGTFLVVVGVFGYIAKKKFRALARFGRLKYWLEFHIFLCTLGPVMILFHTAFKFGGLVSVSFWSMVAVVASGVIGRFIYIQIPRTIEGRELNLNEVKAMKQDLDEILNNYTAISEEIKNRILAATSINSQNDPKVYITNLFRNYREDKSNLNNINRLLKQSNISKYDSNKIIKIVKDEISLKNKIDRLQLMQKLFKYWHVAHLPFAFIMLIIMVIHVSVVLIFG